MDDGYTRAERVGAAVSGILCAVVLVLCADIVTGGWLSRRLGGGYAVSAGEQEATAND